MSTETSLPKVLKREPRPRIKKGRVIYSTNAVQHKLCQDLVIMEYYRPLTFKRVKRVVLPN